MIYERVRRLLSEQIKNQATQSSGRVSVGSSLGRVRKENQDRALVAEFIFPQEPQRDIIAVVICDGIGGMANGSLAAEIATAAFVTYIFDGLGTPTAELIRSAAEKANALVFRELKGKGGSTLVGTILDPWGPSLAVSVGDSRIYATDDWKELLQLSRDDNMAALANIAGNFKVDPAQASHLTQFIGMGDGVDPNCFAVSSSAKRVLLTSDGVHGIGESVLREYALKIEDDGSLVQSLLAAAHHLGGKDNASIAVARLPLSAPSVGASDGLVVRLATAFAALEIWLPKSIASRSAVAEPDPESRIPRPKKPGARKKARKATSAKSLPTTPELKLEFPAKEN